MSHDDQEVGLLEAKFFDFLIVGGSLAFEDDLLGVDGVPLLVTDLFLEVCDLREGASTVWLGSISTANTSPFRFFMLIFMIFQIKFKPSRLTLIQYYPYPHSTTRRHQFSLKLISPEEKETAKDIIIRIEALVVRED